MTIPDDPWWREFIAATPPHTGKLATVGADGAPQVAPIWVALDGDDLMFNTGADTAKGKALRRDPRVAVVFDDETATVLVRARPRHRDDLRRR